MTKTNTENFFTERRMVFFAGGGPECAGDDGVCLPEDVQDSPEVAEVMRKIEDSVKKVGGDLGLETRVLTNSDGNMEFSLNDSLGRTRFRLEMDKGSRKIRVTELPLQGDVDGKKKVTEFASMADALSFIPETDYGHFKQISALCEMTGLGIEGMPDSNGGHLAVFTDRKSGDRVFTVWNNADKSQFVLVKNTPSGGTYG